MKALILSDSHGATELLAQILRENIQDVRHVVHLGDGCDDAAFFSHKYPDASFHVVSGNCDASKEFPQKRFVTISGKKIFMTHGHIYGVKTSYDRICYAALEAGADICLFGHTHVPVVFEYSGIRFMNPGAVFPYGDDFPKYGIIDLSKEPVAAMLF